MNPSKIIATLLIIFSLYSCTKDVDFNQLDDANIHTTYLVTLIHLNLTAIKFLDDFNNEIEFTEESIQAPIANDSKSYLEKVEFTVVTNNTFNRDFTLNIIFYNEFNEPIYYLQPVIIVPENSLELTTIIEIPLEDIPAIYETQYFGFNLKLSPSADGSVISGADTTTIDLKSSVKLFFNFRKI
tara:strand:- start:3029 stop:3580 length:552 start_codon:yes stop_codon:yes gene_type:complete